MRLPVRVFAFVCFSLMGMPSYSSDANTEKTMSASERRAVWLRKVGGLYEGETKGNAFLYLNCADIDDKIFENAIGQMRQVCGIVVKEEREDLAATPMQQAKTKLRGARDVGAVALFYEGGRDEPIESYYPMDRIALVNVAPLKNASDKAFAKRITALACRSVAYIAGGAVPYGVEGCMKNVFGVNGLDSLKSELLHPMSGQLVKSSAGDFGFALWKRGTYAAACQEGWAKPPTNDVQRAVWEKAHQIPDKPLTIEFNPERDK